MNTYNLTRQERKQLWKAHKQAHDKQKADRLKAVYLLGSGWTTPAVAEALLLSENSIRNYYESYQRGGIKGLLLVEYKNNSSYLSQAQLKRLETHLETVVYLRVEDIVSYVEKTFKVKYSVNGMTDLLHRQGFVYKKPKLVPGKSEVKAQKQFIKKYREIQSKCEEKDSIYFIDASHPQYQMVAGYGWIKKGGEALLPLTLTQRRLNINGAISIKDLKSVFLFKQETLKQEDTADLLLALRKQRAEGKIYIIADRGGCYYTKAVAECAEGLGMEMVYLPPYSPNLNVIERLWLYFKKKVLYNRKYDDFKTFCNASKRFFKQLPKHKKELRSLLTDNFQLLGA